MDYLTILCPRYFILFIFIFRIERRKLEPTSKGQYPEKDVQDELDSGAFRNVVSTGTTGTNVCMPGYQK